MAWGALGSDLPPVGFHQVLGDGQPQPAARGAQRLIEAVEDVRELLRRNPCAGVLDRQLEASPIRFESSTQRHPPSPGGVPQGVGDQVDQYFSDADGIHFGRRQIRRLHRKLHPQRFGLGPKGGRHLSRQHRQVGRLAVQLQRAAFRLRQGGANNSTPAARAPPPLARRAARPRGAGRGGRPPPPPPPPRGGGGGGPPPPPLPHHFAPPVA